jgi:hypothetical protein
MVDERPVGNHAGVEMTVVVKSVVSTRVKMAVVMMMVVVTMPTMPVPRER